MVLASDAIRAVFKVNWVVHTQMPLSVFFDTDPVPNLCLIRGYLRDLKQHPTTAALVIEISDTSLRFDTTEKMSLYAAAGIPDYWVLDL